MSYPTHISSLKRALIVSPDGIPFHLVSAPLRESAILAAINGKIAKRYERQGYYSSTYGRIQLEDLPEECSIQAYPKPRLRPFFPAPVRELAELVYAVDPDYYGSAANVLHGMDIKGLRDTYGGITRCHLKEIAAAIVDADAEGRFNFHNPRLNP